MKKQSEKDKTEPNKFAIKVENLTKVFGKLTAVNNISFDVKEGEIFGLLGPNGAGKTTTINMLATLLDETSGKAFVSGHDISKEKDEVRRNIGIVFQDPSLDIDLTGKENLDFHGLIYGIAKAEREKRIAEVLKLVELSDKGKVLVGNYSGGMKRRLEIARGLMHHPKVLFLDEPTLGLDSQTRRRIWDYIKKLNKETGMAIILTTHYMEEADYLCNRVAIIDHGKIVALDTSEKLKNILGGDVISLEAKGNLKVLVRSLREHKWIKTMKIHENTLSLTTESGEKRIPEIIGTADRIGIKITSTSLHKPSLEDVFLHFTGKRIRDDEASAIDKNREFMMRRMRR